MNAKLWQIRIHSNTGDVDVYGENLARGRILVPRLQCLEVAIAHDIVFATSENKGDKRSNPPYLLSRRELVEFSIRVLELAPGSEKGENRPRPTLRLVNLSWAKDRGNPLHEDEDSNDLSMFSRVMRAVEINGTQVGEDEDLHMARDCEGESGDG